MNTTPNLSLFPSDPAPVTPPYPVYVAWDANGNPVAAIEGYSLFGKPHDTGESCAPFGYCTRASGNTFTSFGVRTPMGFLLTVWHCVSCGAERVR